MKRMLPTLALVALAAAAAPVAADVLVLKDGTRLEGRVEDAEGGRVAFISASGRIELPAARAVERIEEPDAKDWTRIGEQFAKRKEFAAAIQHYQRALEADAEFGEAKQGLEEARKVLQAEQDDRVRAQQEKINLELEKVPELLKAEKFKEALEVLDGVMAARTTDEQRINAQRLQIDLYQAWGFSRFDRLDYASAEEKYLRVLEMDPKNKVAREKLLLIWRNNPAKKAEVLKAYQAKLAEEPNNLEYNRIVGDMLYEMERYAEAIAPLKMIHAAPRYGRQGYDVKLRRSFNQAIEDLTNANKKDDGIKLFEDLLTVFPNEDPTRLTLLKYERDKERLEKEDWDGRALLVKNLYQTGLTQFAVREAELILRYDPQNEIADSILLAEATAELISIREAFNQGNFLVARDMAQRFTKSQKRYPKLVDEAQEIYNKSDIEAKRQAKENRESARTIAERGLGYYEEAQRNVQLLNQTNLSQNEQNSGGRRSVSAPVSYKQQAIILCKRAIDHYETALRIDPTLGDIKVMDLNSRLRDARALYRSLTDRPTSLPTVRNRTARGGQSN